MRLDTTRYFGDMNISVQDNSIPANRPGISSSVQASRDFIGTNMKIYPGLNNIYNYLPTHQCVQGSVLTKMVPLHKRSWGPFLIKYRCINDLLAKVFEFLYNTSRCAGSRITRSPEMFFGLTCILRVLMTLALFKYSQ